MPYGASIQALLGELSRKAKAKADALAESRNKSERGLLSVGLKIHCINDHGLFDGLINKLGGDTVVLDRNVYKKRDAYWCLVLPPVGSAEAAIQLVECLEQYTGTSIFGNRDFQLQVCSPARLDNTRSALLAIAFYLASDTVRRYGMVDFDTTVANHSQYQRGKRLVIYDAGYSGKLGEFDNEFEWWRKHKQTFTLQILNRLPFAPERTDVLVGTASALDIRNVNFAASLLVHAQFERCKGWWHAIGVQFERELLAILQEHQLAGIVKPQWVTPPDKRQPEQDEPFRAALEELTSCAYSECSRLAAYYRRQKTLAGLGFPPEDTASGIFVQVEALFEKCRAYVSELSQGEPT